MNTNNNQENVFTATIQRPSNAPPRRALQDITNINLGTTVVRTLAPQTIAPRTIAPNTTSTTTTNTTSTPSTRSGPNSISYRLRLL